MNTTTSTHPNRGHLHIPSQGTFVAAIAAFAADADPKNPKLGRRNLRRWAIAFKLNELRLSGVCPDPRETAKRIVDLRFERAIAAASERKAREAATTTLPPAETPTAELPLPTEPVAYVATLPIESTPLPDASKPKRRSVRRKPTEAEKAADAQLAPAPKPRKPRTPKAAPSDGDAPASKPKRVAKSKPADGSAAPKSRATKTDGEPARRVVRHIPGSCIGTNANTSAS